MDEMIDMIGGEGLEREQQQQRLCQLLIGLGGTKEEATKKGSLPEVWTLSAIERTLIIIPQRVEGFCCSVYTFRPILITLPLFEQETRLLEVMPAKTCPTVMN